MPVYMYMLRLSQLGLLMCNCNMRYTVGVFACVVCHMCQHLINPLAPCQGRHIASWVVHVVVKNDTLSVSSELCASLIVTIWQASSESSS